MIISDPTSPIPIEAIYTDRITFQCQFPSIPLISMPVFWQRLRSCLQFSHASIVYWKRREFELPVNYLDETITVKCRMLCAGRGKPMFAYFSFNPITLHNRMSGRYVGEQNQAETPFVNVNNYLRLDDPATPLDIAIDVDAFASVVQDQLIELLHTFYRNFGYHSVTSCVMHIQHIETFADLEGCGVGNTVELFTRTFPSAFKRTKNRVFRSSETVYGADEEVQFVEGYYRSGIRAKLYEKTNRRIRAEISFTKRSLRYRSIDTHIVGDNSFAEVFAEIALLAQPIFQLFLTPLSTANDEALSVADIEAFAAIICRASPDNAISTINRLVNLPRITTASMSRARRTQLLEAGILEPVDRGVMRLAPRYRQAIERIQRAIASNNEVA